MRPIGGHLAPRWRPNGELAFGERKRERVGRPSLGRAMAQTNHLVGRLMSQSGQHRRKSSGAATQSEAGARGASRGSGCNVCEIGDASGGLELDGGRRELSWARGEELEEGGRTRGCSGPVSVESGGRVMAAEGTTSRRPNWLCVASECSGPGYLLVPESGRNIVIASPTKQPLASMSAAMCVASKSQARSLSSSKLGPCECCHLAGGRAGGLQARANYAAGQACCERDAKGGLALLSVQQAQIPRTFSASALGQHVVRGQHSLAGSARDQGVSAQHGRFSFWDSLVGSAQTSSAGCRFQQLDHKNKSLQLQFQLQQQQQQQQHRKR